MQQAGDVPNSASKEGDLAHRRGIGTADFLEAYERLRAVAGAAMSRERPEHTLQPTALVHEAYLKLAGQNGTVYKDREHFLAVAAVAMRRLLIDHARAHGRGKRAGSRRRLLLQDVMLASTADVIDVLELEESMIALERVHPDHAAVVELKFFGGMTNAEVARATGTTERTIERRWRSARAWLYERLALDPHGDPSERVTP